MAEDNYLQLADVKADFTHIRSVFGLIEEIAFELSFAGLAPVQRGHVENLQALCGVLSPFMANTARELDNYPDRVIKA